MALRPVILAPDPRLKVVCNPVDKVDAGVRQLMDDMLETMYEAPGIGLSVPQVGETVRVLVADVAREGEEPAQIIMDEAGDDAIIVVGASMRSDLSKRLRGGVSMSLLENSKASVLLAKSLPGDEMTWGE